jgi:hypothetical protein
LTEARGRLRLYRALPPYPQPPARQSNAVHQLDTIGPRYLRGDRTRYYFLVLEDAFDGAFEAEFSDSRRPTVVVEFVVRCWQRRGIPKVLQGDNGSEFRGSQRWPRTLSPLVRLCWLLGVEIVFIPAGQACRNGSVENCNGQVQRQLLHRQQFRSAGWVRRHLRQLLQVADQQHPHKSLGYQTVAQHRQGLKVRRLPHNFARHRRPLPIGPGKVSFIRLVRSDGSITLLSERFRVGKRRKGQSVKATIFTKEQRLKVYWNGRLIKQWRYILRP